MNRRTDGLCECGCGQKTNLAAQSSSKNKWVRGQPMRFVLGHAARGRPGTLTTHGKSGTPTHAIWKAMRSRCNNPRSTFYKDYGARGIKIDPRWDDFSVFAHDMGERPSGHSIDRIDNDKGYSPENCKWSTRFEQANNKRSNRILIVFGSPITLADACSGALMDEATVRQRIDRLGWNVNNALFKPKRALRPRMKLA